MFLFTIKNKSKKTKKSKKSKKSKIKCFLPKNEINYICKPSLTTIWKTEFHGKYKIDKYNIYFNKSTNLNKSVVLHTDPDTSQTYLVYNGKKYRANLDEEPYQILKKINLILQK